MRHATIYTSNKNFTRFLKFAKSLDYIKKIETDEEPTKEQLLEELKQGIKEIKLIDQGKMKARPLKELLDEL